MLFPHHCRFPDVTRYMSSQKHAIVETNHEHVHHPTLHKNKWLVVSTPLKNISPWEGYIVENKKCSKPRFITA